MEDIQGAITAISKTAGEIGMTRNELQSAKDLFQRYGDERERIMNEMVSLLEKSDSYNISSDWKSRCEKGSGLLERLNSDLPKSSMGEGFNGVGARDFYAGEKKIWEENGKAQIALVAEVIAKILTANLALIKQCNDDLKTVRDEDAVVQSLITQNFGGIKSDVLDVAKTITTKLSGKLLTSWLKEGDAKDFVKKWYELILRRTEENFKAAQQKKVLKKQILDNIEILKKGREQLDERWIDEIYRTAEDCAKSIASNNATGDYKAADWAKFGDSCIRPLAEKRDDAKEKSRTVFNELLPTFLEESTKAFAALTDDPSLLATWKKDLEDQCKSIDEALASEDDLIKDLAEGPYQQAVRDTYEEFKLTFTTGVKLLFEKTKDAEDEMKG